MNLLLVFKFLQSSLTCSAQEHVSEKRRNQAALIINLSFGAGFLLLPLLAHLIRDWRWLLRTASIAVLVYMPLFWWYEKQHFCLLLCQHDLVCY